MKWKVTFEGKLSGLGNAYTHQIGTKEQTFAYVWLGNQENSPEQKQIAKMVCALPDLVDALKDLSDEADYNRGLYLESQRTGKAFLMKISAAMRARSILNKLEI
jgi:hypothetical protein